METFLVRAQDLSVNGDLSVTGETTISGRTDVGKIGVGANATETYYPNIASGNFSWPTASSGVILIETPLDLSPIEYPFKIRVHGVFKRASSGKFAYQNIDFTVSARSKVPDGGNLRGFYGIQLVDQGSDDLNKWLTAKDGKIAVGVGHVGVLNGQVMSVSVDAWVFNKPTEFFNGWALSKVSDADWLGGEIPGVNTRRDVDAIKPAFHVKGFEFYDGRVRVRPGGNLSMGSFTVSPNNRGEP